MDDYDDRDLSKNDSLDVDLDIAEIDFRIPDGEFEINSKSNWY